MLVSRAILISSYFYIIIQVKVVILYAHCRYRQPCPKGSICFRNQCEGFHLNSSYVRIVHATDKASDILQFQLRRAWYSVVEMNGILQPSMFCGAMNTKTNQPYYLQRKTTVVDEAGCVMIKSFVCQTGCIGEIQNLQNCSEKYRLSLICNSDSRVSAISVNGNIDQTSLHGHVEAIHDNQWFGVCSRLGHSVNLIQIIIGEICKRNKFNKLEINEVCAAGTKTTVIYMYNQYVFSIHEEECSMILQAKCVKDMEIKNQLQVSNKINSKIMKCDIVTSQRFELFQDNTTNFVHINDSSEDNFENGAKRDSVHYDSSLRAAHATYGVIISILILCLIFTVIKIFRMMSKIKALQNLKMSKQPNVRFVKPGKISFKMTKKEEIRIISDSNVNETGRSDTNKDIIVQETPVPVDRVDKNESGVIYATPQSRTNGDANDVHDYADAEFEYLPKQNSLDSKIKESREQYDKINTYEDLSQIRVHENVYLEIDKRNLKKK